MRQSLIVVAGIAIGVLTIVIGGSLRTHAQPSTKQAEIEWVYLRRPRVQLPDGGSQHMDSTYVRLSSLNAIRFFFAHGTESASVELIGHSGKIIVSDFMTVRTLKNYISENCDRSLQETRFDD